MHDNKTGALSLLYSNETRGVCSRGWNDNDARVACRELYDDEGDFVSYRGGHACSTAAE